MLGLLLNYVKHFIRGGEILSLNNEYNFIKNNLLNVVFCASVVLCSQNYEVISGVAYFE